MTAVPFQGLMTWPKSLLRDGAWVRQCLAEVTGDFYTGGVTETTEAKARVQRVGKEVDGRAAREEPETGSQKCEFRKPETQRRRRNQEGSAATA